MTELAQSRLLRDGLAERPPDANTAARNRLRESYLQFKQRAGLLAGEIARSFEHLTVHDDTHLDAVWEMADLAAGDAIKLNPLEAYVLGGAILVHDLGLAVAAYAAPDELRAEPRWSDALTVVLERHLGHPPTRAELANATDAARHLAEELLLRRLHAVHAERLARVSWTDDRGESLHLIEDSELRRATGAVIGQLAHSHWWETHQLAQELDGQLGPPPFCPPEWTVDLLKLACLLRVADAMHLDARRAPMFLRALRRPDGHARYHWSFQERLNRPFARGDRAEYTSGDPFAPGDSHAWWLCFETLRDVDRWLRQADTLLSDLGRPRLALRGVVGVDEPRRLAKLVRVAGWTPVDTHVQVSDVAGLVKKLGGRELYGDDKSVGLRELIQNGVDAVSVRRTMQRRGPDWGSVTVRMGEDDGGTWIEVDDEGVGMTEHTLTRALLDFGTSYWASEELPNEFPGLLAAGFESIGQYGIGFFSVFMLGSRVRVTTRPYRAAESETQVLEFAQGVQERPLLRPAREDERRIDGGTCVRIWLDADPSESGDVFYSGFHEEPWTLHELCTHLCPALDVRLSVEADDKQTTIANDWRTIPASGLIQRLAVPGRLDMRAYAPFAENMRSLEDEDGNVLGRLAIVPLLRELEPTPHGGTPGALTVGGLRSSRMFRVAGVVAGASTTAARTTARLLVSPAALASWASEQARLLTPLDLPASALAGCASVVYGYGGNTGDLPIAESSTRWLNAASVIEWARERTIVRLVSHTEVRDEREEHGPFALADDVLAASAIESAFTAAGVGEGLSEPHIKGTVPGALEALAAHLVADAWGLSAEQLSEVASTHEDGVPTEVGRRGELPVESELVTLFERPTS